MAGRGEEGQRAAPVATQRVKKAHAGRAHVAGSCACCSAPCQPCRRLLTRPGCYKFDRYKSAAKDKEGAAKEEGRPQLVAPAGADTWVHTGGGGQASTERARGGASVSSCVPAPPAVDATARCRSTSLPLPPRRVRVTALARAFYLCRDAINTPANDMGPQHLAAEAVALAAAHPRARVSVLQGDALLDEGWPAVHTVGRASTR